MNKRYQLPFTFSNTLFFFLVLFAIHGVAFFLIADHGLIVDERFHFAQIYRFMHGDYTPESSLPMLPGFHHVLAGIGRIVGIHSLPYYEAVPYVRLLGFLFHLISIVVFYLVAKAIDTSSALIKTAQYSFFPLFFPFFPLLYTDLFSNTFLLVSLFCLYKRRYVLAGLVAGMSLYVRQNNLIWLVFFVVLLYVKEHGYAFKLHSVIHHVKKTASFFIGPIVLGIYLVQTRSLAVGQEAQPYFTGPPIYVNNLFMIFAYYFVLFMPIILSLRQEMMGYVMKKKIILVFLPALAFACLAIFQNTHPLNGNPFFLHNAAAMFFTQSVISRVILLGMIIISLLSLIVMKLHHRAYALLLVFSVLFLLPLWLMDLRYYATIFTLFLLWRNVRAPRVEYITILLFLCISIYLYYGVWSWQFFL